LFEGLKLLTGKLTKNRFAHAVGLKYYTIAAKSEQKHGWAKAGNTIDARNRKNNMAVPKLKKQ
jgi:hypothetical protein